MTSLRRERIALPTGVELDVTLGGPRDADPIIFLHGFPESSRTWRHQLADLSADHFVVAPDQRGYARSSKPSEVSNYAADRTIGDIFALADTLGIGRFTLVGHDWGGAIAWGGALSAQDRVARLIILNAPHPLIFQKTLIEEPAQREASQYIRAFRSPGIENAIAAMGASKFFDTTFARHADVVAIEPEEREAYIDQWSQPGALTAMLNWYRASTIIVPAMDEDAPRPAFLDAPFPHLTMPVLVVWGVKDVALLPSQLEGLDELVDDLTLVKVDAGHFVTWEAPDQVNAAIRGFLATHPVA